MYRRLTAKGKNMSEKEGKMEGRKTKWNTSQGEKISEKLGEREGDLM